MQDTRYMDEWIHVPLCKKGAKLYHYTMAEGVRGIVENKEFLATKSDFLNDKLRDRSDRYDMIILDPPAFTKSRSTLEAASRGYKQINMAAMRLLPRGGILATCSCSHFMTEYHFERMLMSASRDAGVSVKILEKRQQAPDHPVLMGVDETAYLKFYILQIV